MRRSRHGRRFLVPDSLRADCCDVRRRRREGAATKNTITQAAGALVTSRRNFLVRAFGLTAAGATCAVPIITMASAQERIAHHLKGLEDAYRDLYPGVPVLVRGNDMPPELVLDAERGGSIACHFVTAGPHPDWTRRYRADPVPMVSLTTRFRPE